MLISITHCPIPGNPLSSAHFAGVFLRRRPGAVKTWLPSHLEFLPCRVANPRSVSSVDPTSPPMEPSTFTPWAEKAMKGQLGRYKVRSKLGEGAMATVYLAEDPILARLVAIKVLHPQLIEHRRVLERFFHEARTVARIKNPHVVDIHDIGQNGKSPYMVMEFVDGQTLQGILDQVKPGVLDARIAAALICQAAEGLTAAAECGIVHRDLKPANMLITPRGYLKIADFGLAHLKDQTLTRTGMVLGSHLYMSPEQTKGVKPITPQSDLFSIGCVFYSLLSGKPPFHFDNIPELYHHIVSKPHVSLSQLRSDLDPELCRLIDILLEKEPQKRGGGPQWLKRQLRKYLMQEQVIDPMEAIETYVQNLSRQGVQITSEIDRNALAVIISNMEQSRKKISAKRGINVPLILFLVLTLLLGGGLVVFLMVRQ